MKIFIFILFIFILSLVLVDLSINCAFADTATSSSSYNAFYGPQNVLSTNYNSSSYWNSAITPTSGQWIAINFEQDTKISSVSYSPHWQTPQYSVVNFDLEYTTDAVNWLLYKSYTNMPTDISVVRLNIPEPFVCKSFRMRSTSNLASNQWLMSKIFYTKQESAVMTFEQYSGLVTAINGGSFHAAPVMGMNPSYFNANMALCGIVAAGMIWLIWSKGI